MGKDKHKHWFIGSYITLLLFSTVITSVFPKFHQFIRVGWILLAVFSVFLVIYQVIHIKHSRRNKKLNINSIDCAVILFWIYLLIRVPGSPHANIDPEQICVLSIGLASYFLIRCHCYSHKGNVIRSCNTIIILFGVFQCLYALGQYTSILPQHIKFFALGGTYQNPGILANVLVIPLAIASGWFSQALSNKEKLSTGVASLLLLITIILTNARTAWIASAIVLLYNFKHYWEIVQKRITTPVLYGILFLSVILAIFLMFRIYEFKQDSADGRLFIYQRCLELIQEKPIFGHGYNSFIPEFSRSQIAYFKINPNDTENGLLADNTIFAFNDYLQYTIEYGIIGLCLLLLPLILIMYKPLSANDKPGETNHVLIAPLIGIHLCMLFSYPLQNPVIILLYFIIIALLSPLRQNPILEVVFKRPYIRMMRSGLIIASIATFLLSSIFIHKGYQWKKAYNAFLLKSNTYSQTYVKLLPLLKHDRHFLYHYGVILFSSGKYSESIAHYEQYYPSCINSNMLIYLGDSYEYEGVLNIAEEYYIKAIHLKPHLFVPRYKLFTLYIKSNQTDKAILMAKSIQSTPVKVFSEQVQHIKTEINAFLIDSEEL